MQSSLHMITRPGLYSVLCPYGHLMADHMDITGNFRSAGEIVVFDELLRAQCKNDAAAFAVVIALATSDFGLPGTASLSSSPLGMTRPGSRYLARSFMQIAVPHERAGI